MSTFTHAGTSRLNGTVKVRFANDAFRAKVLEKNGHTEVDLIELPSEMTKEDAVAYLAKIEFYKANDGTVDAEVRAAIEDASERRAPRAQKAPKTKSASKPTMEGIKAKITAKTKEVKIPAQSVDMDSLEEAPF